MSNIRPLKCFSWIKNKYFEKTIPTDQQVLQIIYSLYLNEFLSFNEKHKTRDNKVYVPIDISKVASSLHTDPEMIFGRLYYHLNKKYSYDNTPLFEIKIGNDRHVIQFPLMESILSELLRDNKRYKTSIYLSIGALILSIVSIVIKN